MSTHILHDDQAVLACLSRPIAFHRVFEQISGGATSGLLLSQLWYWRDKGMDRDGWIYKTQAELEAETSLTRREQETARKTLRDRGLLEECKRGVPAQLFYRVDVSGIIKAIRALSNSQHPRMADSAILGCTKPPSLVGASVQTSMADSAEQGCAIAPDINGGIRQTLQRVPKTTTEITSSLPLASARSSKNDDDDRSKKSLSDAASSTTKSGFSQIGSVALRLDTLAAKPPSRTVDPSEGLSAATLALIQVGVQPEYMAAKFAAEAGDDFVYGWIRYCGRHPKTNPGGYIASQLREGNPPPDDNEEPQKEDRIKLARSKLARDEAVRRARGKTISRRGMLWMLTRDRNIGIEQRGSEVDARLLDAYPKLCVRRRYITSFWREQFRSCARR